MKPLKTYFTGLVLLLFVVSPSIGEDLSGIPGAFVDIGLGTRPLGLAGAYTAVAVEEDAARWNPAALARTEGYSFGFSWTNQFNMIPYNYLAARVPVGSRAIGFYAETSGDDVLRENTIALASGINIKDIGLIDRLVSLQSLPDGLRIGMTAKIRWASFGNNTPEGEGQGIGQVEGNAFGYSMDIGLLWDVPYVSGLSLAWVGRDLINNITWDSNVSGSYTEGVPRTMFIGVAYNPTENAMFTLDFKPSLNDETNDRMAMGLEYTMMRIIALRAGVAQDVGNVQTYRDVTLGMGVRTRVKGDMKVEAGVSYLFDTIANTPRVGLRLIW